MAEMLKKAVAHHQSGDLNSAERLYQRVLRSDPEQPDALNLMGVIFLARGESERALSYAQKAVNRRPQEPSFLSNLGNALKAIGRFDEANQAYRDALVRNPRFAAALTNLGVLLIETNKPGEALGYFRRAIEVDTQLVEAHQGVGDASRILGRMAETEKAYRQALQIKPDLASAANALASLLRDQERFDEAYVLHDRAIRSEPADAAYPLALARTAYRQGDVARAVLNYRLSLKLDPASAHGWNELGRALRAVGNLDEAHRCFRHALALDGTLVDAHRNLVLMSHDADLGQEPVLRSFLSEQKNSPEDQVTAGFALGKLLDGAGRFDEAFSAYTNANALHRRLRAAVGQFFDPAQFLTLVEDNIKPKEVFDIAEPSQSELPVYIVGMPRSGTTLVEQIIASHPAVFGGGELRHIRPLTEKIKLSSGAAPSTVTRDIESVMSHLEQIGSGASRVVDKMPDNLFHIRTIQSCFPRARLIFCRRHPLDTCLSNYFQLFSTGNLFSYDLKDCGRRYEGTDRVMAHWMAATSLRWTVIDYENLVANLEQESRQLIEFLGLDWDPSCLNFHETQRAVQTASAWQVRQHLFTSSIGRWKLYEGHLLELRNVLVAAG